MSSSSQISDLANDLRRARIPYQREFFIPLSDLERLITTPVINQVILDGNPNISPARAQMYADKIEQSSKRLLAILLYLRKGPAICSFLDSKLSDEDLPFLTEMVDYNWSLRRRKTEEHIQAFDIWADEEREEFDRKQWWMIAPVFSKDNLNCLKLEDKAILPFIHIKEHEKNDKGIPHMKNSGYSEVTAYRIHPAHHDFWDWDTSLPLESQPLIVDKRLFSTEKIEFLKEKTILDALGRDHPNLIQLLASYQKGEFYHLIFPCADCNLRTYWEKNAMPNFDKETVLWSIRQMSGIACAIDRIHTFRVKIDLNVNGEVRLLDGGVKLRVKAGEEKYGRHGDIKPENILLFKDGKVLKITDFGLGRFHGRDSRSGIDGRKVHGTLTYEPPECSLGKSVSRKYDIWGLGCLFLEFVTWLLEGSAKVDEFANARGLDVGPLNDDTFFTVFTGGDAEESAEVRVAVIEWVDRLRFNDNCSALIHDLLDLVMESMLRIDPEKRKTAKKLKEEMGKLVARAENSRTYLMKGVPRPLRTPLDVKKPSTSRKGVRWADGQTSAT